MWLKRQQERQLNNKGFSLMELIVIVAIMAVMIGVASITYNVVKNANVTKAANSIDDLLSLCREKAMTNSAKEWKVVIDGKNAKVIKVDAEGNETEIKSQSLPSNVRVYVTEDGVTNYDATVDQPVSISFKLLSGEVASVYTPAVTIKGSGTNCGIVVDYKEKKQSKVILYYATGKHSVE